MGKSLLLLLIISFFGITTQAQPASPVLPTTVSVLPPGPTAASLGRYGDIPVGYYTGVPNITVPLHDVKSGRNISVPVSLNYHASGIRVDDLGSWVGLGWSLDCGGVITRTVHGLADETPNGYRRKGATMIDAYNAGSLSASQVYDMQSKATDGKLDLEPDVFSFNVGGRAGQFLFDHQGHIALIPQQGLLIEQRTDSVGFTITDEAGTVYQFLNPEYSTSESLPAAPNSTAMEFISSWYLSRITPAVGSCIKFEYSPPVEIVFPANVIENKTVLQDFDIQMVTNTNSAPLGRVTPSRTYNTLTVRTIALQQIRAADQTIVFYHSVLPGATSPTQLDSLGIYDLNSRLTGKYRFSYTLLNDRNFLLQVQQVGADGTAIPPTKFTYNESGLPARFSASQDHWGYANANDATAGLVPTAALVVGASSQGWSPLPRSVVVEGATREPDSLRAQAQMLTSITYPTGGYTAFKYELHSFGYVGAHRNLPQIITKPKQLLLRANSNDSPVGGSVSATFRIATEQVIQFQSSISVGGNTPSTAIANGVVTYECLTCGQYPPPYPPPYTEVRNGVYFYKVSLLPGTYRAHASWERQRSGGSGYTTLVVSYQDSIGTTVNRYGGGMRIRQISSQVSSTSPLQIKQFSYRLAAEPARSSGCSVSGTPTYQYKSVTKAHEATYSPSTGVQDGQFDFTSYYQHLTSSSASQAGSTQGSPVGYIEVTVLEGAGGINGKTVYKFSGANSNPDLGNGNLFPFGCNSSYDYRRGQQVEASSYQRTAAGYSEVV